MMRRIALACALTAAGCGHEQPVSGDLETSEIGLSGSIQSNGSLTIARLILSNQTGSSITLSAEDALLLSAGGVEAPFEINQGSYLAAVQTPETDLSLILERAGGERVVSALPLPPAFALIAPSPPASRAAGVTLAWEAAEGEVAVQVHVQSPCFTPFGRNLTSDPGSFSIQVADTGTSDLDCDFQVEITRSWKREFSPALAPNFPATLQQIRTIRFTTTP